MGFENYNSDTMLSTIICNTLRNALAAGGSMGNAKLGEVEIADGKGPALVGALDSVETYNPAIYRGGILRLHYARAQELGPWLDLVAVRGAVVVPFWLKPGDPPVALGKGEEPSTAP
jgi:inner membrane protein